MREEHKLQVFKKKVPRQIFGPKTLKYAKLVKILILYTSVNKNLTLHAAGYSTEKVCI
jgi:hypothetical protein